MFEVTPCKYVISAAVVSLYVILPLGPETVALPAVKSVVTIVLAAPVIVACFVLICVCIFEVVPCKYVISAAVVSL